MEALCGTPQASVGGPAARRGPPGRGQLWASSANRETDLGDEVGAPAQAKGGSGRTAGAADVVVEKLRPIRGERYGSGYGFLGEWTVRGVCNSFETLDDRAGGLV
jgi:hypothetical protein